MKKYLPSVYLSILALGLSFLIGYVLTNSLYNTSVTLVLFSIFYILFGLILKRLKLKQLRREENDRFAEFEIEDKRSFYLSVRIFYLAGLLTIILYYLCYYIFDIGKNALL